MSVKSIHGYGMIFQCKGPALDPNYNGKMFTVADMKKFVNRFYKRKNVMKLNENHKGSRAEVGVVHNMWIADDNRLMVHVELVSRNPHSRLRIKELLGKEMVGLSLETSGEEILLPNGLKQIANKRITGVATTDKPDHENTHIIFADTDLDKVLVHAFQDSYVPDAENVSRPLLVHPSFQNRIAEAFQRTKTETPQKDEEPIEKPDEPVPDDTPAVDTPGEDKPEKKEEKSVEEDQPEVQAEEVPREKEETPDPMEMDSPEDSNNTNGEDFNDQTSKDKVPEPAELTPHSTPSTAMDQDAPPQNDEMSVDIEKIMKENEALKKQFEENERKRKREEQEEADRSKKQRTEDGYRLTKKDKETELNEAQRLFNEYLQLQGIHQGGSEEDLKKFLADTLRKKSLKAKESLKAMSELIDADLQNLGPDVTDEERENIKRVAMDTSNPEAAAALQTYISVAHRSRQSHRAQEEKFQAEQRQAQLKFQQSQVAKSTSVLNNRQSVLPSSGQGSLLSRSMDRFRNILNPSANTGSDHMEIDEPVASRQMPTTRNIGLGHNQAQTPQRDQNVQHQIHTFMPVEKRIIPDESIRGSLGSIIQKFGMDSLRTTPVEVRWDRNRLGHEDGILSQVYHYFEKNIPDRMATTIPGKQLQLDTRPIYDA